MAHVAETQKIAKCDKGFEISVSADGLQAFLLIDMDQIEEERITPEDIIRNLNCAGVTHGIKQDKINEIVDQTLFREKHLVAEGTPPQHGKGADFDLCFEKYRKVAPKEDEDGRIDYRDLDFLQNAESGQILVKKIPPTKGTPGKTVTNKEIPAHPGKDKKIPKGANTEISPDGMTLAASKSGTVVYSGSVVSVQPVTTIPKHIDLSTGNITCKGSLKVLKDVKSDMKVNVVGDLEINGIVEDAEINCKGNVIVKGGFMGRGDGVINADGNVTVKYVINQKINSGGVITVGGEVVNSKITARNFIDVISSTGKIVGGVYTARNRIRAQVLGADAGTRTILKVAYDEMLFKKLKEIESEIKRLKTDEERVKEALVGLYKLKISKKIQAKQLKVLKKLEAFKKNLPDQFKELELKQSLIRKKIREFSQACIIAEKEVYPGVQAHIGNLYKEMNTQRGPTIFEMYSSSIIISTYEKEKYEQKEQERKKQKEENK